MNQKKIDVVLHLEKLKQTFIDREKVYKDGHYRHAAILDILFPNGIHFSGDKGVMFVFINMIIIKLVRFCDNFGDGGHKDSIHDLSVYGIMLDNFLENGEET